MSGLSPERRLECVQLGDGGSALAGHEGTRELCRAIRDLLAESAALRTERDEEVRGGPDTWLPGSPCKTIDECPTFYDGCNCTAKTLAHNIDRAEKAEDELARRAPASPDDLARVADELAAEVCRCADCVPYGQPIPCDRARIADRLRSPLAVALARLTPPTGPSVDGDVERVRAAWVAKLRADLESLIATRVTPPTAGPSFLHIFDALAALLFLAHTSAPPTGTAAGNAGETRMGEERQS